MAPEPLHLVNITKSCLHCNSTDVKFVYLNNYKLSQPRYKCNSQGCGRLFTFGGKIRAPRVVRPPRTSTTSTSVVAAGDRTGAAQPVGPRRSLRVTPRSAPQEIQETPATCARTEARTGATCARTEARTGATCARTEARTVAARTRARPSTGALRLRRISKSENGESPGTGQSLVQGPVQSPAVQGPVPAAYIAGQVRRDVVDVDQRIASRTAATVIAQGGDVKVNWTKAVLGVPPYELAPASSGKRRKVMRIKYDGKESVVPFWDDDSALYE